LRPDDLDKASEGEFAESVEDFVRFAKGNFFEAFGRFNQDAKRARDAEGRQRQMLELQRVGQSGELSV